MPIRLRHAPDLGACTPWFPVVGALIGLTVGVVAAVGMEWLPASVAAAVAVLAGVALTGAFHEDGLADTADALGGMTPERRREILKDFRQGSYGVAALCGTILLRTLSVASLGPAAAAGGLVAAHTLGRGAAVVVMALVPRSTADGLGATAGSTVTRRGAVVGTLSAVTLGAVAVGWWVGPLVLAAAIGAAVVARLAVRAFGGVSGDLLGATEQVAECLVLVVVTGLATRSAVWWS